MQLSEIASLSGKSGLFKVIAPTKSGAILETLDETKSRLVVTASQRLSVLSEISIYTTTKEGTVPLLDVLIKIKKDFGNDPGVNVNSDPSELKSFIKSVIPEYDENRVYVSDIKKLVKWYSVLLQFVPEVFEPSKSEDTSKAEETKKS